MGFFPMMHVVFVQWIMSTVHTTAFVDFLYSNNSKQQKEEENLKRTRAEETRTGEMLCDDLLDFFLHLPLLVLLLSLSYFYLLYTFLPSIPCLVYIHAGSFRVSAGQTVEDLFRPDGPIRWCLRRGALDPLYNAASTVLLPFYRFIISSSNARSFPCLACQNVWPVV